MEAAGQADSAAETRSSRFAREPLMRTATPLVNDDFAYATRDGLVPDVTERTDEASIKANGLSGPFAEIEFDIHLTSLVNGVDNQINEQRRRAAA